MSPVANRGLIKHSPRDGSLAACPYPKLRDDYIIVKTVAVALNPTDSDALKYEPPVVTNDILLGTDCAGFVVEVGKDVRKPFKKGDRVAGSAYGGNDARAEDGCFAEYVILKGDISILLPDNISFVEGATLTTGTITVAIGLFKYLDLAWPSQQLPFSDPPSYILIYGGSTATGTLAIQLAKRAGQTVITTCSPRNFELVKSLGADHVLDYHDPDCGAKIRALANNTLNSVFDTKAIPDSAAICAAAISSSPLPSATYCNILGEVLDRKDVKSVSYLGYSASGEAYTYEGVDYPADKEMFALGVKSGDLVHDLLSKGELKPHPSKVVPGGLGSIFKGMQDLDEGRVSGEKLVYLVDETKW